MVLPGTWAQGDQLLLLGEPVETVEEEIAVAGRVVDENSKPAPGAEVAVVLWEVLWFSVWERPAIDRTSLVARTTSDVLDHVRSVDDGRHRDLAARARARVLAEHTAHHRAEQLEGYVAELRG